MIEPVNEERCDGCGQCMIYCAEDILQFDRKRKKVFLVHPEGCITCYRCIRHCPQNALKVSPVAPLPYRGEPVAGTLPIIEYLSATQGMGTRGPNRALPEKSDVVIVGAGVAGLVAAIAAREDGASPLVLDKAPDIHKTNTSRSGGNIRHHQERCLDPNARELTVEERIQQAMSLTGGRVAPDLIRAFAEHIDEDIQWLTRLGMRWKGRSGEHRSMGRATAEGEGPGLNKQLLRIAQSLGCQVIFSVKVEGLLTDGTGAIAGVRTMSREGFRNIETPAVVLATGGFQANQEMLIRYLGTGFAHSCRSVGSPYSTGDGHRMAESLGAKLVHMDQLHCTQADKSWTPGSVGKPGIGQLHPSSNYGILVNRLGRRFVDETAGGDSIANSILAQPRKEAALIIDERIRALDPAKVDGYVPAGTVIRADSLTDIARTIGCPYGELERTIREFNANVVDGAAPGLDIHKERCGFKIETPPYCCIYPVWATLNCTLGGPLTTSRAQIINLENSIIPGLYAAGEMVGGFYFGQYRHTGGGAVFYTGNYLQTTASLANCLVFARVAGKEAAAMAGKAQIRAYGQRMVT